ncbi:unnamed protein product [Chrysodeixis includens]|uniref:Uncharacterized protein n=1 Tax=Chrysodeixis includens TaxID=689277 RepID=A0A9N8KPU5_CHRIL|nr:unnamed protein product [Chrysodeixis includens]
MSPPSTVGHKPHPTRRLRVHRRDGPSQIQPHDSKETSEPWPERYAPAVYIYIKTSRGAMGDQDVSRNVWNTSQKSGGDLLQTLIDIDGGRRLALRPPPRPRLMR